MFSLQHRPGLANFEYEPTHLFAAAQPQQQYTPKGCATAACAGGRVRIVALFEVRACSLSSLIGWVCLGQEVQIDTIRKKRIIRTVEAIISNTNGPNIHVENSEQGGSDAAPRRKREDTWITDRGPRKQLSSRSSAAQMNVPHTHGVACWYCWAAVFSSCALCVLAAFMAMFIRGQKIDPALLGTHTHVHIFVSLHPNLTYVE